MRNLTKTLAVVSLLAPSSGYSLGIGDIKLHSALNQNLDAEISLVVSSGEKASDIKVNLAPPDKFDEAGVSWTSLLSKIKFETIVGANGSVIIKLSSREAVTEPFLDFLLEVSWPKGSLYREFTVLLDPPTAYNQATIPVLTSSESYKPEQDLIPQYQPTQKLQTSVERESISRASEYVSTHRNDTLWKIAEQASRQAGVSVEQMMIAMYEENPHAFYEENVHSLLAGKTLKIPEREILLKFSRKQALAEFNRQTKAWKNRLTPAAIETAAAKKDTPDNQLTLVAPIEADVAENVAIAPENGQVTAKNKVDDAASKTIDKGDAGVISPVNDALQDKVAELEKQLAMMQQILALKDQQLTVLQNQFQAKSVVQPEADQAISSGQTGTVNPVTQQKPVQPDVKPVIQPEPEATSSINTYYLWVGGVGAGTLSLFGWLWWRKRKLDERTNDQSLFASSGMSKSSESKSFLSTSIEKDTAKNADTGGKSSFFSEFTFDDFDVDQGEIDPVSEADVYLAYGRYQQAEELLRDVIKNQPDRDECKLKLLEIFYSNENKHAFETYANELVKAGKKDDVEFWAKVTEMGSAICQDSTLFSSEADEFSPKDNTIFEKKAANLVESDDVEKNEVTDIKENNFSLSSFGESFNNGAVKEIPQATVNLLDFDLNFYENEIIDEPQNNESIDFDLSTNATKEESNETLESLVSKTRDAEVNDEFESFDFYFGSNETEVNGIDEIETSLAKETVENHQLNDNINDQSSGLN
ncbi:MAG: fimbrial protein FimV, partial [Methylococcaceae bacterium]|nr:fimbrial protein FimV [Methylococcaceae bacterium]